MWNNNAIDFVTSLTNIQEQMEVGLYVMLEDSGIFNNLEELKRAPEEGEILHTSPLIVPYVFLILSHCSIAHPHHFRLLCQKPLTMQVILSVLTPKQFPFISMLTHQHYIHPPQMSQ